MTYTFVSLKPRRELAQNTLVVKLQADCEHNTNTTHRKEITK